MRDNALDGRMLSPKLKVKFAALGIPVAAIIGGLMRTFGMTEAVTLAIVVPVFVAAFLIVTFSRQ